MKSIFATVAILLLAQLLSAQKLSVSGKVTNEDGEALTGATVTLRNTTEGVITDSNGKFRIELSEGEYELSVSFIGYKTQLLKLKPPFKSFYSVSLATSSVITDEVVISATRAGEKTPMAYKNVSKEEIRSNNMGQDVGYLLALTPSVVQSSESGTGIGYTNFRIRGTDPSRINITVDGIPLNDAESQQVFWVNMPAFSSSMNSIQIQRGVGTSTNGAAAFGASVNIETESPSGKAYAEITSAFGSYNTLINTVKSGTGLINKRLAFDVRYSKMKSDGYVDYATSDNESVQLTGICYTNKGRIKANIILGEQHTGISWWGIDKSMLDDEDLRTYNPAGQYITPSGEERYYKNQTDNYRQNHYHLVYSTSIFGGLQFNTSLFYVDGEGYYEQFKMDQDRGDYYLSDITLGNETIYRSDLVRQKWLDNNFYGGVFSLIHSGENLQLTLGGGLNYYEGDHFGKIIWMRYAGETEKDHEWYRNSSTKTDGNIYVKTNYEPTDKINIFADLQYRYVDYQMEGIDDDGYMRVLDQDHQFNFFNPKAGVNYDINKRQKVYASFSIANREPTRQNFKDATGDENATPNAEQLQDLEAGYSINGKTWAFATNLYYMNYKDQLVPTGELSTDGYPVMTNVDKSYRTGIELSFGIKPVSFLEWNANLTLSDNKIKDYTEYYTDYDADWNEIPGSRELGDTDIAYSPSVITSSDIAVKPVKDLSIHLISQYVGEQYFVNTINENLKMDSWFVNNLRVDYLFSLKNIGRAGVQFQINNLFNELYENNAYGGTWWEQGTEYYWSAYFPQATRNYLMKLSLRF